MKKTYWLLFLLFFIFCLSFVVSATELTLRPNGLGDRNDFTGDYTDIDEAVSDDNTTYIEAHDNADWQYEIVNIDDHTSETAPINFVTIYANGITTGANRNFQIIARISGSHYSSDQWATNSTYYLFNYQWTNNPATGSSWTWSNIDDLQIGVRDKNPGVTSELRFTQLYAVVNYSIIPDPVTNETWSISSSGTSADLTLNWTKGNYSDRTLIRRAADSYPSSVTDGSLVYNNTGNGTVDTGLDQTYYYTFWTYNATDHTYSTPVYLNWSASWINVYNESNPSQNLTNWDVEISNEDGTEVYYSTGNSNSLIVNVTDMPTGDEVTFIFNCTGYKQRLYVLSIADGETITLDAYLPPDASGSDTSLYQFSVVGPQGEYGNDPPIEGATVDVMRYNNVTDVYEDVGTYITDANGQFEVHLINSGNVLYRFKIVKDGYNTEYSNYVPTTSVLTHTFRLTPTTPPIIDYDDFWTHIDFYGTMQDNSSILVYFSDSNASMNSVTIECYEYYDSNESLNDSHTENSLTTFTYYITGLNKTRDHILKLNFSTTANYNIDQPVIVYVWGINKTWNESITRFDLEARFVSVFGSFELGYCNTISIIIAILLLVTFGPFHVGAGIIGAGLGIGFIQGFLVVWTTNSFNVALAAMSPLIIALGILYTFTVNAESAI